MVINVKKGDCSQGGQVLGFRGIRSVGPRLGVAAPNLTLRRKDAKVLGWKTRRTTKTIFIMIALIFTNL